MQILQTTIPHINQLARLTEALRGNYTLEEEEYNEWNEWAEMKDEEDEAQFMRDQRIIRRELRDWGRENNPNFDMDEELEKRHDDLIFKPRNEPVEEADEVSDPDDLLWEERHRSERKVKKDFNRRSMTKQSAAKKLRPLKTEISCKEDDIGHSMKKEPAAKKPRYDAVQSNGQKSKSLRGERRSTRNEVERDTDTKQPIVKKRERRRSNDDNMFLNENAQPVKQTPAAKKLRLRKNDDSQNQTNKNEISRSTAILQSDEKSGSTRSSRPSRKCHDCKETTNQYRKCSYWQITGNKCGKTFCITCLSSKYTLGGDVLTDENPNGTPIKDIIENGKHDSEWFCPSCLQTCMCDVCVKQRKREEEKRAKSRDQGERRASRRSTEQTDYSNFFQANGGGISFF